MVGAVGLLAVLLTACGGGGGGGAGRQPAAGASAVAAGAPGAAASPSTGGAAAGGAAAGGAAATGGAAGGPVAVAFPGGVSLSVAELPAGSVEQWKPLAAPRTVAVSRTVQVNECASIAGAAVWQQSGYVSVYQTPAEQDLFSFHDASAARSAYQSLVSQMGGCQAASRALQTKSLGTADAQVAQTATTGQGTAWSRHWTGVQGFSASGVQTDHLYAVQQGSTLAVVHFDEWAGVPAAPYSTRSDADLLTAVAHRLG